MADNLTQEQRSYCMSRVRSKDTGLEMMVRSELHKNGLRFRKHVRELPGKPDVVFSSAKVAVFIDGDFWHGYQFRQWKASLSSFWREKISTNRKRDERNFAELRGLGWRVIRIWGHEIKTDLTGVVNRIHHSVLENPAVSSTR